MGHEESKYSRNFRSEEDVDDEDDEDSNAIGDDDSLDRAVTD